MENTLPSWSGVISRATDEEDSMLDVGRAREWNF